MIGLCATPSRAQYARFSEGIYRVPYEDGENINMGSTFYTHQPQGKYDMWADDPDKKIVAAASGWVRGIQESFNEACFTNNNGNVTCCWDKNNYVIIEHPNGEFSGYTHMKVNSVSGEGISMNQWVTVGTPIGIEGNVGCSTGRHLHFEVGRPDDPNDAFWPIGGFLKGELLVPVICGIGTAQSWFVDGGDYPSGPCDDNCPNAIEAHESILAGEEKVYRADNLIWTPFQGTTKYYFGSVAQYRSGTEIIFQPGFEVHFGAKFEAFIKNCNEQQ